MIKVVSRMLIYKNPNMMIRRDFGVLKLVDYQYSEVLDERPLPYQNILILSRLPSRLVTFH